MWVFIKIEQKYEIYINFLYFSFLFFLHILNLLTEFVCTLVYKLGGGGKWQFCSYKQSSRNQKDKKLIEKFTLTQNKKNVVILAFDVNATSNTLKTVRLTFTKDFSLVHIDALLTT